MNLKEILKGYSINWNNLSYLGIAIVAVMVIIFWVSTFNSVNSVNNKLKTELEFCKDSIKLLNNVHKINYMDSLEFIVLNHHSINDDAIEVGTDYINGDFLVYKNKRYHLNGCRKSDAYLLSDNKVIESFDNVGPELNFNKIERYEGNYVIIDNKMYRYPDNLPKSYDWDIIEVTGNYIMYVHDINYAFIIIVTITIVLLVIGLTLFISCGGNDTGAVGFLGVVASVILSLISIFVY